jgi:UDP-N-acetylmuramate dehydrogenase
VKPDVRDRLLRHLPCSFKTDEILAPYTTFQIGGPAAIFAEPASISEAIALFKIIRSEGIPFFYLGLGSNLLISDRGFDGIVIRARGKLCDVEYNKGLITAGPGAKLIDLTCLVAKHELSGMESLCGIPGSVGGGLWMNAGAYGAEICDTLHDIDVITPNGNEETLTKADIHFGYRSAPELRNMIILQSRFIMEPGDRLSIYREMRLVWKLRREKQPLEYPSAGSVFKRPQGDYAGRLIEAVGGKGLRMGGAMVSYKHAGFIVNFKGSSAEDVASLVREVRKRVKQQFGILLEPEVKPVGFENDPFAIEN